jgi:hypothetical protein
MPNATDFNFDATYSVEGYRGIAWYARSYAIIRRPLIGYYLDEDGTECEEEIPGEFDEEEDRSQIVATMVGDDRKFTFPVEDFRPLERSEYCAECGQIGCEGDAYSEED